MISSGVREGSPAWVVAMIFRAVIFMRSSIAAWCTGLHVLYSRLYVNPQKVDSAHKKVDSAQIFSYPGGMGVAYADDWGEVQSVHPRPARCHRGVPCERRRDPRGLPGLRTRTAASAAAWITYTEPTRSARKRPAVIIACTRRTLTPSSRETSATLSRLLISISSDSVQGVNADEHRIAHRARWECGQHDGSPRRRARRSSALDSSALCGSATLLTPWD